MERDLDDLPPVAGRPAAEAGVKIGMTFLKE